MKAFFKNKWTIIGLFLAVFGWGPLCTVGVLAAVGLWPDPNPNPIGPGLLFFATFWPAIVCFALGIAQTLSKRPKG